MNGYHLDWGRAITAGVVVVLTMLVSRWLFPNRRAAPYFGVLVGVAILILGSYLSWRWKRT